MKNICIFILLGFLFFSCARTKPIVKPRELKQLDIVYLYDSIRHYYGNYSTFSTRFSAKIATPKMVQTKGSIRIHKDSIIWISITAALNIEAARVLFTPDSVFFINRIEKSYYAGDYGFIAKLTGVHMNYQSIQSLLLNELLFYPFENTIDTIQTIKTYDVSRKKNDVVLQKYTDKDRRNASSRRSDSLFVNQSINIFMENFRISGIQIEDDSRNLKVQTKYANFIEINEFTFPQNMELEIKSQKNKMKIDVEYEKSEFNIEQSYPFTINTKFKQIGR